MLNIFFTDQVGSFAGGLQVREIYHKLGFFFGIRLDSTKSRENILPRPSSGSVRAAPGTSPVSMARGEKCVSHKSLHNFTQRYPIL